MKEEKKKKKDKKQAEPAVEAPDASGLPDDRTWSLAMALMARDVTLKLDRALVDAAAAIEGLAAPKKKAKEPKAPKASA
jgi:hypothetical protein